MADDHLDALLAAAEWPAVTAAAERRARATWRAAAGRRRPAVAAYRLAGGAAAAAGVAFLVMPRRATVVVAPTPARVAVAAVDAGRPPTPVELAAMRAAEARGDRAGRGGVSVVPLVGGWHAAAAVPPATIAASTPVDAAAVADELADPSRAGAAIERARRAPDEWTDPLFAALGDRRWAARVAAGRGLAAIGSPAVVRRLIRMADAGPGRPEAVAALVRIDSPDARRYVAAAARSPSLGGATRTALAAAAGRW